MLRGKRAVNPTAVQPKHRLEKSSCRGDYGPLLSER
jgi:hypothetical protein